MPTSLTTNYNLPIFDLYSNPAFLMFFIGPIILLLGLVCVNLNILKQYPYLIVLLGMIIITLLSFNVWGNFIPLLESIQIGFVINFFPVLLNGVSLGLDGLSLLLVILTNFFILLGILSLTQQTVHLNEALGNLLVLQIGVCLAFVAMDLIGFFTFFEITLIPIYFLILGWGSRERRARAGYMISLYTIFGSAFMLYDMVYLFGKTETTGYDFHLSLLLPSSDALFIWGTLFFAFAAKIPTLPLHLWLPEAHVEAPTVGSVMLAALLLKLGTYGLIRFGVAVFSYGTAGFFVFAAMLGLLSITYTGMTAMCQIDLKKVIAYSSIGHMNVVVLGIISGYMEGMLGAIFTKISHGIISGALFFSIGVIYTRHAVRSLKLYGGLTFVMPFLSAMTLIFTLGNIGFPLTSGYVGEFTTLFGIFLAGFLLTLLASTGMVLGAAYMLWVFNRVFYGNLRTSTLFLARDVDTRESFYLAFLVLGLLWLGIDPTFITDTVHLFSLFVTL